MNSIRECRLAQNSWAFLVPANQLEICGQRPSYIVSKHVSRLPIQRIIKLRKIWQDLSWRDGVKFYDVNHPLWGEVDTTLDGMRFSHTGHTPSHCQPLNTRLVHRIHKSTKARTLLHFCVLIINNTPLLRPEKQAKRARRNIKLFRLFSRISAKFTTEREFLCAKLKRLFGSAFLNHGNKAA